MRNDHGRQSLRCTIAALLLALFIGMSSVPGSAEDTTVLLDHFWSGSKNATLAFDYRNSSDPFDLLINIPRGAAIISANVTLKGVPGPVTFTSTMDFDSGVLGTDVWARHEEATDIYGLNVDPYDNTWHSAGASDVAKLKTVDGNKWHTSTPTTPTVAPWEWPIQLFHFQVNTTDAVLHEVTWLGHGECLGNNTWANYSAEFYIYDHDFGTWDYRSSYQSVSPQDEWFNVSFRPTDATISSNGSVDVAIVGMHAEVNNSVVPAVSDYGHLYTDYVGVVTTHTTEEDEYPEDVTIAAFGHYIPVQEGPLTGTVDYGSKAFRDALQEHIDHYPQQPGNVTIGFEIYVARITLATVYASDLRIWYDSTGVIPNDPPVWTGPTSLDVKEDSPWKPVIDLDSSFTDDHDQGDLQFSIDDVSHPGGLDARIREGLLGHDFLEVRPLDDYYGDVEVIVAAADSGGERTQSPMITVHIEPVPDAPWLLEYPVISVNESERLELPMTVLDPDMPDDSFTFSDTSDLFDIDPSTGIINWTPSAADVGKHTCTVTVEDSYGLSDSVVLIIDVLDVNHRPVITSAITLEAKEGQTVTYWITAEDEDIPQGDTLTFSAWSMDVDLTVDPLTGRVSFATEKGWVGQVMFFVRAEDSLGEGATASVTVDVVNVNDPPTLAQLASQTHLEGATVSVRLAIDDPDLAMALEEPELLTITTIGPSFLHADALGYINLTVDQSMVGEHVVTYTVTDRAGLSASIEVLWTLLDVNEAPAIVTDVPSSLEATEDQAFTYTVAALDGDGDDLTWSDDSPLFQIDPVTGVISFTPTQAHVGTHVVTITVSDGNGGSASVTFDLVVANVNDAPVIVMVLPADGTEYKEGDRVQLSVEATDEDGDALTFVWREGGVELGAGSPLTLRDLAPGTHTITLVVSDGHLEATRTLDIYVEPSEVEGTDDGIPIGVLLGLVVGIITAVLFVVMMYQKARGEEPPEGS